MTMTVMRARLLNFGGWNKPSPLGWVLLFAVARVVEFQIDLWWVKSGAWVAGVLIALLVLPQAVDELKRVVVDESPPWEYKLWSRVSTLFGQDRLRRFFNLFLLAVFLVAIQVVLYGLNVTWTAVLRDVGLQLVMVLFFWNK
jgi:hypothetical protein